MSKELYKRKKYFIDKSFQARFILKFCLVTIVSSVLMGCILFFFSRNSTTVAVENTKVIVKTTADFILPIVIETLFLVTIFSAVAVIILTLFISHKISGPLYRLRRGVDALGDGDLRGDFNIRSGDQLGDLSASLNNMCASLRQRMLELKDNSNSLKGYLEKNDFCISDNEKGRIKELLEKTGVILKYFRV